MKVGSHTHVINQQNIFIINAQIIFTKAVSRTSYMHNKSDLNFVYYCSIVNKTALAYIQTADVTSLKNYEFNRQCDTIHKAINDIHS